MPHDIPPPVGAKNPFALASVGHRDRPEDAPEATQESSLPMDNGRGLSPPHIYYTTACQLVKSYGVWHAGASEERPSEEGIGNGAGSYQADYRHGERRTAQLPTHHVRRHAGCR